MRKNSIRKFIIGLSNYYFSHQFAPYLNQPKATIRATLNKLYDAHHIRNMDSYIETLNEFPGFPGYPYYRSGSFLQHMRYASCYFRKTQNKQLPKIPVIATPKSASSYICVILSSLFDIPASILAIKHHEGATPWVNAFGKWGGVTHEHYYPSQDNLEKLQNAGITRCVIHTRDPMESLVSKAFHWIKTENIACRADERILLAQKFLEPQIEALLEDQATWLKLWRKAAADGKIEILETHYEDMKTNPLAFFKRILSFSGVSYDEQKLVRVLEKHDPRKKRKKYNFRKALKDEWKTVLTPEQIARAKKVIDTEFSELR